MHELFSFLNPKPFFSCFVHSVYKAINNILCHLSMSCINSVLFSINFAKYIKLKINRKRNNSNNNFFIMFVGVVVENSKIIFNSAMSVAVDKKVRNLYYEKLYRMRGELPVGFKSKVHVVVYIIIQEYTF